jgi:hypothetical protein
MISNTSKDNLILIIERDFYLLSKKNNMNLLENSFYLFNIPFLSKLTNLTIIDRRKSSHETDLKQAFLNDKSKSKYHNVIILSEGLYLNNTQYITNIPGELYLGLLTFYSIKSLHILTNVCHGHGLQDLLYLLPKGSMLITLSEINAFSVNGDFVSPYFSLLLYCFQKEPFNLIRLAQIYSFNQYCGNNTIRISYKTQKGLLKEINFLNKEHHLSISSFIKDLIYIGFILDNLEELKEIISKNKETRYEYTLQELLPYIKEKNAEKIYSLVKPFSIYKYDKVSLRPFKLIKKLIQIDPDVFKATNIKGTLKEFLKEKNRILDLYNIDILSENWTNSNLLLNQYKISCLNYNCLLMENVNVNPVLYLNPLSRKKGGGILRRQSYFTYLQGYFLENALKEVLRLNKEISSPDVKELSRSLSIYDHMTLYTSMMRHYPYLFTRNVPSIVIPNALKDSPDETHLLLIKANFIAYLTRTVKLTEQFYRVYNYYLRLISNVIFNREYTNLAKFKDSLYMLLGDSMYDHKATYVRALISHLTNLRLYLMQQPSLEEFKFDYVPLDQEYLFCSTDIDLSHHLYEKQNNKPLLIDKFTSEIQKDKFNNQSDDIDQLLLNRKPSPQFVNFYDEPHEVNPTKTKPNSLLSTFLANDLFVSIFGLFLILLWICLCLMFSLIKFIFKDILYEIIDKEEPFSGHDI